MKQYLFYTQHEHDPAGQPITALYLTPKEPYLHDKTCFEPYEVEDIAMVKYVCNKLGMTPRTDWEFESPGITPPEIIKWICNEEHRKIFSTTDKFALMCKTGVT